MATNTDTISSEDDQKEALKMSIWQNTFQREKFDRKIWYTPKHQMKISMSSHNTLKKKFTVDLEGYI